MFLVSFKQDSVSLYRNEDVISYLNTKTNINNISFFNRFARIFNLERTFNSFFKSELSTIVKNEKFLELEYDLVKRFLLLPRHIEHNPFCFTTVDGIDLELDFDIGCEERVLEAANAWLNHKTKERKNYKGVLLATLQAALKPSITKYGFGLQ